MKEVSDLKDWWLLKYCPDVRYTDLRSVNRIDLIDFCLCFLARVVEELMSFRLKKVATQNFV